MASREQASQSKSNQPQVNQENKPVSKRKVSIFWRIGIFVVLFFYLFLIGSASTLVFILFGLTIVMGVLWAVSRSSSHNAILRVFKYAFVGVALFVLVITSLGIYLFNFAGPIVPQVNNSTILDASLTSYLQTLEQSPSFRFLQTEHFGTLIFRGLSIHSIYSNAPGGLQWLFYEGDLKSEIPIGQSGGQPYHFDIQSDIPYSLPQNYPSNQEITNNFKQIDSLGLHWFYNQAVVQYQNATGDKPITDVLTLDVGFDNISNYQGITLVVTAEKAGLDNFGNKIYSGVFEAEFQPNGTMLSFKTHPFL